MEDRLQSEFNMAVSYLNRLNNQFYICNEAAMNLDAFTWFHSLMVLYRELSTEMKDKEIKQGQDMMEQINPLIADSLKDQERTGRTQVSAPLYSKLHHFEMMLRKVLKASGLQLKIMEDPRFALR